jgi:hypothetical protein
MLGLQRIQPHCKTHLVPNTLYYTIISVTVGRAALKHRPCLKCRLLPTLCCNNGAHLMTITLDVSHAPTMCAHEYQQTPNDV